VTYLYATIPGQDYDPRKPRVAEVFKDENETDDPAYVAYKREKEPKTKSTKGFCLQPTKLHLIILILTTGIADLPKNYLFHWLESPLRTDWQDALILCGVIPIILKLHGWMLSIYMTKMDCASLQQFSISDNNASSYAKPTFLL
jgi:hypothetical protein